jgi:hypothetical protein
MEVGGWNEGEREDAEPVETQVCTRRAGTSSNIEGGGVDDVAVSD